jgi:hypothetical protein
VVELSAVDEGTLERTLNDVVAQGWSLDGIQFAMRESSKRPAMAFVLFTREGRALEMRDPSAARERLRQLAEAPGEPRAVTPHQRLLELAASASDSEDQEP